MKSQAELLVLVKHQHRRIRATVDGIREQIVVFSGEGDGNPGDWRGREHVRATWPRMRLPDRGFRPGGGALVAHDLGVRFLGCVPMNLKAREDADREEPSIPSEPQSSMSHALLQVALEVSRLTEATRGQTHGDDR